MRFSCSNSALLARHQHLQLQQLQQQQLQICSGSVDIFGKKYEKKSRCIFNYHSKLYYVLDAQLEIQILNYFNTQ